jgi:putative ABC transport system permease protein
VTTLDRKLVRDLARMKGQVVTIALVVACGIAAFVSALATYQSLRFSQRTYYARTRFAHVFARLERAPASLDARMRDIPGVAEVEPRLVFDVSLDAGTSGPPAVGRMVSVPAGGQPALNALHLRAGGLLEPGRTDEVLVSEGFAGVHRLRPGDRVSAVLNGRRQSLRVAGIALSPEYVFALRGGDPIPDDRGFAVLWTSRAGLEAAFDMAGAFNDVVLTLAPGADVRAVIDALDRLLEPYGGLGAIARAEQPSHRFIEDEIRQNQTMATTVPPIFLGVAAFLLNVVLGRLVTTQREQIAAMKAVGYGDGAIAGHYLKFVLVVVLAGAALGIGLGAGLGRLMLHAYAPFVRMPRLSYHVPVWIPVLAVLVSVLAAMVGAFGAVRGVVMLAPAEAMRPPTPRTYRRVLLERLGRGSWLGPRRRMAARNLSGRPVRTLLTITGIACAAAIVVLSRWSHDAVAFMLDTQFRLAERGDATVVFTEPVRPRAVRELAALPGVRRAEGVRGVAVQLRAGHRTYRTTILGLSAVAELRRTLDADLRPIPPPPVGMLLTDRLAERLGVRAGDEILAEIREGERPKRVVVVAGLVNDMIGMSAYMDARSLARLLREDERMSFATLAVDRPYADELYRRLRGIGRIATVSEKRAALRAFEDTTAEFILVFTAILTVFAVIIAVGVVYNTARIALQERAWELASLRVLGFTRAEVSRILLAEISVQLVAALPVGMWLGYQASRGLATLHETEMFRIPVVVDTATYAWSAIVVLVAGAVSALIVRRRIDALDLVGVLKTRE